MKIKDQIKITGHAKFTLRDIVTGKERVIEYDNLITTVGRTMLADNLTNGSPDNTPRINWVSLGSGTTAPANGDTALETFTYANAIASETNASNVAYFTGFFDATETTGTYREAGLFADSTDGTDGILFSHVAIDITKSATETLTVDWTVTLT